MHPLLASEVNESAEISFFDTRSVMNKFIFLFYGRLEPYKGLEFLIEAFKRLQFERDDVYLVVAGKGKISRRLRAEIRELEDRKTAVFINRYLSDKEVHSLIRLSDVVVIPYTEATQSGIIPQVLPLRKPIITTCVDGLVEQSFFGQLAMLVPPKNSFFLYLAMKRFCENNETIKAHFARALEKEYKLPTFDDLAENIINFVESL
ncbi:glycosyltransferase [Fervidobacterium thailandense]|nr:glycosyltransferase [Fervidobacterium thailandense]